MGMDPWISTLPVRGCLIRFGRIMEPGCSRIVDRPWGQRPVVMWLSVTSALLVCASMQADAKEGTSLFSVTDYGAVSDGETLCTQSLQQAIDACRRAGGGMVRFPGGTYLSGGLRMRSGVTLELVEGATLLGSRKLEDYYQPPEDEQGRSMEGKPVFLNLIPVLVILH